MTGNGQKTFRSLSEILELARNQKSKKMVVAAAEDLHVLQAVLFAQAENIIDPILVAVLKSSRDPAKAQALIDYLQTEAVRKKLRRFRLLK